MKAPNNCPMCGEFDGWKLIDKTKKGFSGGKALAGGILLGGVGLVAGFMGKKKAYYQCVNCGFSHEYDDIADKEKTCVQANGFTKKGLNSIWIDTMVKCTPDCPFCGNPQDLSIKAEKGASPYHFLCGHCGAEYSCDFTFGSKVKASTTQIHKCGSVNKDNLSVGTCDAKVLVKDESKIKY